MWEQVRYKVDTKNDTCFTALEYFEGVENDPFWTSVTRRGPTPTKMISDDPLGVNLG